MPNINVKNAINPKINNIVRFVLGVVILRYVVLRTVFSWNQEVPALFYFTILSNVFLAVYWITSPWLKENIKSKVSFYATVYMTITGTIFITMLNFEFTYNLYDLLDKEKIDGWVHYYSMLSSIVTHYIMPVLALLDYLIFTDIKKIKIAKLKYVFVFPVAYLVFHIIYSQFTGKYIYPFMNPEYMGGVINVIAVVALIIAVIVVLMFSLYYLNRFIQRRCEKYYTSLYENGLAERKVI